MSGPFHSPAPPVPVFQAPQTSTPQLSTKSLQDAFARAKFSLGRGRTTFLEDASDSRRGGKAQNALALISDYGLDSDDEEDDSDDDDEASVIRTDGFITSDADPDEPNCTEDALASFFDELQHEGLLEDEQAHLSNARGDGDSGQQQLGDQKVLKWLSASWALVEDTASSQRYHWNCDTNEVSWDVPSGLEDAGTADAQHTSAYQPHSTASDSAHSTSSDQCAQNNRTDRSEDSEREKEFGARVEGFDAKQHEGSLRASDRLNGSTISEKSQLSGSSTAEGQTDDGIRGRDDQRASPQLGSDGGASNKSTDNVGASGIDDGKSSEEYSSKEDGMTVHVLENLPGGWVKLQDEGFHMPYYWHETTNLTQWERPKVASSADTVTEHSTTQADSSSHTASQQSDAAATKPDNSTDAVAASADHASTSDSRDVWVRMHDESSGSEYFWHEQSGDCKWQAPEGSQIVDLQDSVLAGASHTTGGSAGSGGHAKTDQGVNGRDTNTSSAAASQQEHGQGQVGLTGSTMKSDSQEPDAAAFQGPLQGPSPGSGAHEQAVHVGQPLGDAAAGDRSDVDTLLLEGMKLGPTASLSKAAAALAAAQQATSSVTVLSSAQSVLPRLAMLQAELAVRRSDLTALTQSLSSLERGTASVSEEAVSDITHSSAETEVVHSSEALSALVESHQGRAAVSAACLHIEKHVQRISKEIPAAIREFLAEYPEHAYAGSASGSSQGKIGLVLPSLKRKRGDERSKGGKLQELFSQSSDALEDGELPDDLDNIAEFTTTTAPAGPSCDSEMHEARALGELQAQPPLPESPGPDGAQEEDLQAPPLPEEPPPEDDPAQACTVGKGVGSERDRGLFSDDDAEEIPPRPDGADVHVSQPSAANDHDAPEQHMPTEPHSNTPTTAATTNNTSSANSTADPGQQGAPRKRHRTHDSSSAPGSDVGGSESGQGRKQKRGDRSRHDKKLTKSSRTSALVSKWQNVAKELEEEDVARQQPVDLEARDRARTTDVLAWVADQHRTGAAATNPNFIPISNTWRDRVAARVAARAEAAAAAAAQAAAAQDAQETLFFDTQPDLDVLSVGLLEGWRAMWDPNTKGVYYGNVHTKGSFNKS